MMLFLLLPLLTVFFGQHIFGMTETREKEPRAAIATISVYLNKQQIERAFEYKISYYIDETQPEYIFLSTKDMTPEFFKDLEIYKKIKGSTLEDIYVHVGIMAELSSAINDGKYLKIRKYLSETIPRMYFNFSKESTIWNKYYIGMGIYGIVTLILIAAGIKIYRQKSR